MERQSHRCQSGGRRQYFDHRGCQTRFPEGAWVPQRLSHHALRLRNRPGLRQRTDAQTYPSRAWVMLTRVGLLGVLLTTPDPPMCQTPTIQALGVLRGHGQASEHLALA
eukprot:9845969-Alexandrium_andersonii.AAC.1